LSLILIRYEPEKHWILVIYQAFFAFVHLGNASAETAFYEDYAQGPEVVKETLLFSVAFLGDALVVRPTIFPVLNHPLIAAQGISPLDNMGTKPPRHDIPNLCSSWDGRCVNFERHKGDDLTSRVAVSVAMVIQLVNSESESVNTLLTPFKLTAFVLSVLWALYNLSENTLTF
jgi:hypothetical protein